ncbi:MULTISPECIES: histidine kinase [unclassified Streptomyces]|uniref:sensor histidine kinase n=1 Tax=unclassified Streptomyces TaxID=2593676 RepID=UPI0034570FFF
MPPAPRRLRALPRPHRDDALLAAAGLAGGVLLWALGVASYGGARPLGGAWVLLPLAVAVLAGLYRRTLPRAGFAAGCAAVLADLFTRGSLATVLLGTDLVYAVVVYGPPRWARVLPRATALVTLGGTAALLVWLREPAALLLGAFLGLVSFLPASSGAVVRGHREEARAARLLAERTAQLAERDRVEALAAERARMARELHDIVAGHLSAIAVHSSAALAADDPALSREALGVVRANSVAGLTEMRRLIHVLRAEDEEPGPAPRLSGIGALLRRADEEGARHGLRFRLEEEPVRVPLPAPVELAAYRIVQESVTNALKHAAPGEVRVRLRHADELLRIDVTSPRAPDAAPRAPGAGAGLLGMSERAALLDGTFRAGPEDTRWTVRATLPTQEEATR